MDRTFTEIKTSSGESTEESCFAGAARVPGDRDYVADPQAFRKPVKVLVIYGKSYLRRALHFDTWTIG